MCVRLEENIKLKSEIDGAEVETHGGVKQLLRRYEKYRVRWLLLADIFTFCLLC